MEIEIPRGLGWLAKLITKIFPRLNFEHEEFLQCKRCGRRLPMDGVDLHEYFFHRDEQERENDA